MAAAGKDAAEAIEKRGKILAGTIKVFLAEWDRAAVSSTGITPTAAKGKHVKGATKANAAKETAKGKPAGSKKPAAKDPKDEAIAKLMQDLDDKINKSKRCKLEDIYNAVAGLDGRDKHALSSITAVYGSKLLPDKQVNEASMAIRDSLCAAAAAHSLCRPQTPEASKSSAAAFRQQGLPASCTLQAGYTVGQLRCAGYSTAELVQSGAPLSKLRAAGIRVSELYSHLPAAETAQLSGVGGASQLRAAGYTLSAVQEGAAAGSFSTWDLKTAGYQIPAVYTEPPSAAVGGQQSPRTARHQSSSVQSKAPYQQQQQQQRVLQSPQVVLQQQVQQQLQQVHSEAGALRPAGSQDVQYFRHHVKSLMQMQAERDVAPVFFGTRGPPAARAAAAAVGGALPNAGNPPMAAMPPAPRIMHSVARATQKIKWDEQLSKEAGLSASAEAAAAEPTAAAAAAAALGVARAIASEGEGVAGPQEAH